LFPKQKTYDEDLKKNARIEIEVHYLPIEIENSTIRHKQHYEIALNLGPRMVAKW
jgi:hypothetical protein